MRIVALGPRKKGSCGCMKTISRELFLAWREAKKGVKRGFPRYSPSWLVVRQLPSAPRVLRP